MLTTQSRADYPPNPLEKNGYTLEFHDEFDGTTLDADRWIIAYLPQWSSTAQSAPNYTMANSNLVLQITQDQQPWCPEFDGEVRCSSIQTGSFSGALGSKIGQHRFSDALIVREAQPNIQKYTPQYGYFEIRAKGLTTSANHVSLWMIGYEDAPERSAEIALFELLGIQRNPARSGIRYGVHPWGDPDIAEEFYEDYFEMDSAQFHIYALEWTPTHLDFYIDNVKIRTIQQSPDYPMQFMLSVYELPFDGAWTGVYDPTDPYPRTFTVDYLRTYQPIGGYPRDFQFSS
jgi:hypothetical protein